MAGSIIFRPSKLTDVSMAYDDAVFVHPTQYDAIVGFTAEDSDVKRGGSLLTLTNMSAQGQQSYFFVKCVHFLRLRALNAGPVCQRLSLKCTAHWTLFMQTQRQS